MSVVFVVVPMVIAGWPTIAAAVGAACAALGYCAAKAGEQAREMTSTAPTVVHNSIQMEMANSEVVSEAMVRDQSISYEKDGVVATFTKDARGALSLHVGGERSTEELSIIGRQLMNRVRQQFAYEKVKQELSKRGFVLVDEHVDESENIRISVRRFN